MKIPFPKSPSAIALLAANMLPLVGVVLWGWSVFETMFLFWLENVVVGMMNVLKMAIVGLYRRQAAALFITPFFCVHYGLFTMVHGVFVFLFFGQSFPKGSFDIVDVALTTLQTQGLWFAAAGLCASHLFSLVVHFILTGEYKSAGLDTLMKAPYARIVILHITVLFGGFVVMATGAATGALVLLVLFKTGFDLAAHARAHRGLSKPVQEA